jgi:hypothetical protein
VIIVNNITTNILTLVLIVSSFSVIFINQLYNILYQTFLEAIYTDIVQFLNGYSSSQS